MLRTSKTIQDPAVLTRRQWVKASLAGGASLLAAAGARGKADASTAAGVTRFVHLTDVHLYRHPRAIAGFAAALESIGRLDPLPDFLITGGDHVMDAFAADRRAAEAMWDLYAGVLAEHTSLTAFPVIGNHDVWGWGKPQAAGAPAGRGEAYGKAMAMDRLGMTRPYYSFDRGGWHFVCLDNVAHHPSTGYTAAVGEAQLEWLRADLAATGRATPICIVSHIPLLAACAFFDDSVTTDSDGGYRVPATTMQRDVGKLLGSLLPDGGPYNVRLALSGHTHLVDRVDYRGVSFLCNGSVCGNWWQGPCQQSREGYAVVDVWPDGSFRHEYVPYAAADARTAVSVR